MPSNGSLMCIEIQQLLAMNNCLLVLHHSGCRNGYVAISCRGKGAINYEEFTTLLVYAFPKRIRIQKFVYINRYK